MRFFISIIGAISVAPVYGEVDSQPRWVKHSGEIFFCEKIENPQSGSTQVVGTNEPPGLLEYTLKPAPPERCIGGDYRYMLVDQQRWAAKAAKDGSQRLPKPRLLELPHFFDGTDYEDSGIVSRTLVFRLTSDQNPKLYIATIETTKRDGKKEIRQFDP